MKFILVALLSVGVSSEAQKIEPEIKDFAFDHGHMCLLVDNEVRCGGDNFYGQSSSLIFNSPRSLSVGSSYNCVLDDDGVWCWGYQQQIDVPALGKVDSIYTSIPFACALGDQGLKCWGQDAELFDKSDLVTPKLFDIGNRFACALDQQNSWQCWGLSVPTWATTPPRDLEQTSKIVLTEHAICGLENGQVFCWREAGSDTPTDLTNVEDIQGQEDFFCALAAKKVFCWGDDSTEINRQLTDQRSVKKIRVGERQVCLLSESNKISCYASEARKVQSAPVLELHNPYDIQITEVAACSGTSQGIKCWGGNPQDHISISDLDLKPTLYSSDGGVCLLEEKSVRCRDGKAWATYFENLKNPTKLESTFYQVCVIDDGSVLCVPRRVYVPIRVPVPELKGVRDIQLGSESLCALFDDRVECFGPIEKFLPKKMVIRNATEIAMGTSHLCALSAGKVLCWGKNDGGATQVPPNLENVNSLSVSYDDSCATSKGKLYCWGEDEYGLFTSPPNLGNVTFVTLSWNKICVLDSGEVKCWGRNDFGTVQPPPTRLTEAR